jgi:Flp pilus assembly CpaE family ATPase
VKVLAIIGQKGGNGKTTTVLGLAVAGFSCWPTRCPDRPGPTGYRRETPAAPQGLTVCPIIVFSRAAHGDAGNLGKTTIEYDPKGKAAQEMTKLYDYIAISLGLAIRDSPTENDSEIRRRRWFWLRKKKRVFVILLSRIGFHCFHQFTAASVG